MPTDRLVLYHAPTSPSVPVTIAPWLILETSPDAEDGTLIVLTVPDPATPTVYATRIAIEDVDTINDRWLAANRPEFATL